MHTMEEEFNQRLRELDRYAALAMEGWLVLTTTETLPPRHCAAAAGALTPRQLRGVPRVSATLECLTDGVRGMADLFEGKLDKN